jgi:acyl carrier protein
MSIQEQIERYIVATHAPDLADEVIPRDYDLVANGVIDSLALLELVEWVQGTWSIDIADVQLSPADFRTIEAVEHFILTHSADALVTD